MSIKLSLCIPTYNRADYLDITLQSIVNQNVFKATDAVEIVISDNCSTDETEVLIRKYIEKFGNKIIYARNIENIGDKNFEKVLSLGKGQFLKLNNDTLTHTPDSLTILLADIDRNRQSGAVLFYLNQGLDKGASLMCNNLDEFISRVLYFGTWIGSFGIWRADFEKLTDFSRFSELLLTQTDVLYRTVSKTKNAYVNNDLLFISLDYKIKKKGGYDLLTVFLENHNYILKEYLDKHEISDETYYKFISRLLLVFFRKYLVSYALYPEKFQFKSKSKFKRIVNFYKPHYWLIIKFFVIYYNYLFLKYLHKISKSVLKTNKII